ncbi:hypothetical protein [Phytopseudomonas dryadis]|uniref:DNA-binding protein n=1 Tax=Phytopseudomonas dryadis TaxID=2487520 RepID=A0A4Q9R4R6_9GAMM|nr:MULTISPECIES: hypothetical protein [Pseudomonas]TBU95439.1 hypothetical protein DNK44_07730 [Pseudomonas dryadis]TBV03820.1 hypothetical protein DNK34_15950 [Pseudomonas dryadis]TBV16037.1 hypothetical protein DNK41_16515 [Pseudomonas sp. FRB 230]
MEELDLSPFPDSPRYVSLPRFAQLIGHGNDLSLVRAWVEAGELPVLTAGAHVLVDLHTLKARQADGPP